MGDTYWQHMELQPSTIRHWKLARDWDPTAISRMSEDPQVQEKSHTRRGSGMKCQEEKLSQKSLSPQTKISSIICLTQCLAPKRYIINVSYLNDWLILGIPELHNWAFYSLNMFLLIEHIFYYDVNAEMGFTVSNNLVATTMFNNQGMLGLDEVIKNRKNLHFWVSGKTWKGSLFFPLAQGSRNERWLVWLGAESDAKSFISPFSSQTLIALLGSQVAKEMRWRVLIRVLHTKEHNASHINPQSGNHRGQSK